MTAPGDENADQGDTSSSPPATEPDPLEEVLGDDTLAGPRASDQPEPDDGSHQSETDDTTQPDAERWSNRERERQPPRVGGNGQPRTDASGGGRSDDGEWKLFTRDVVTSVLAVALLGVYLFAISGVWPPMVAIESGSMEPNMDVNDLVFLMETERFQPSEAQAGTGIVTAAVGEETGYENYGESGDVIVFAPDGNENTTPIIHRAMFWVEEGEDWCEQADSEYLGTLEPGDDQCVADNDGFITKGDNNGQYDQADMTRIQNPVKSEWVVGTAEVRIPGLGWFRLRFQ